MKKTRVVFRVYKKKPKEVIALFPRQEYSKENCWSYMHHGQHGGVNYLWTIEITRPATKEESRELREELEGIGYNLDERKRYIRK